MNRKFSRTVNFEYFNEKRKNVNFTGADEGKTNNYKDVKIKLVTINPLEKQKVSMNESIVSVAHNFVTS